MSKSHRGFTRLGVLVSSGVVVLLIAVLIPAIHIAREHARANQCQENLQQIGMACLGHERVTGRLPTGGWGRRWVGDPDRGDDRQQPGGWIYNLLPFLDQAELHDLGKGEQIFDKRALAVKLQATVVPGLNCPARRTGGPYPNSRTAGAFNSDPAKLNARSDYAINGGDREMPSTEGPGDYKKMARYAWPDTKMATGVCFVRSEVRLKDITDGASSTYLVGEKYLDPKQYTTGQDDGDRFSMYQGVDLGVTRWTGAFSQAKNMIEPLEPRRDQPGLKAPTRFGSAHADAWNAVFCDGAVRAISYTIDRDIHRRLGNRADGQPVDVTQF